MTIGRTPCSAAWLMCVGTISCSNTGSIHADDPPPPIVLQGITLVDGRGGPAQEDITIAIADGRIRAVTTGAVSPLPEGATVIDMRDNFAIPGLIDTHVHIATDPSGRDADARDRLRAAFYGGVTTVRDMGGDALVLREHAAWAAGPRAAAPRIHYSAIFAGPPFFADPRVRASSHGGEPGALGWQRAVDRKTDMATAVRAANDLGVSGIKIYADLDSVLLTAIAAEADRQELPVWSHATVYPSKPSDAIAAGVDVLSHAFYLLWEISDSVPLTYHEGRERLTELAAPPDVQRLRPLFVQMRDAGAILEPTLRVVYDTPPLAQFAQWCSDVTRLANELKVLVTAGTDGMVDRGESVPNIHEEMALLVSAAGLTPMEAIRAATQTAGIVLGIDSTYGTIEVNKVADILILDSDPLADIRNTRNISAVIKGGYVHHVRHD